ncbi:MAG: hypothetical protein LW715_08020 [Rhodobacter sp.]|nr:hypothetical protein [Rhodobacter sp.]
MIEPMFRMRNDGHSLDHRLVWDRVAHQHLKDTGDELLDHMHHLGLDRQHPGVLHDRLRIARLQRDQLVRTVKRHRRGHPLQGLARAARAKRNRPQGRNFAQTVLRHRPAANIRAFQMRSPGDHLLQRLDGDRRKRIFDPDIADASVLQNTFHRMPPHDQELQQRK